MALKMIHFFEDEDDGLGWSEVWFLSTTGIDTGITIATQWAAQRVKILSPDVTITYARISANQPADNATRPRQQRQAALIRLNEIGAVNGAGGRQADTPWQAVKARWTGAVFTVFRTQLLRGLPDVWFDKGSDKTAQAAMSQWFPGALNFITANGMQIRHLNPVVPPATARVYSYVTPSTAFYEGYTRRATGRPFGLPRGRQPNRT
jgi:hypothetical protein